MRHALLFLSLLMIAPLASAQVDDFDLEAGAVPEYLAPDAATSIGVNVTVGCGLILQNAGEADVSLGVEGGDGYINGSGDDITFAAADCLGGEGTVTKAGTIDLTPVAGAMGLEPFDLTLTATLGESSDSVAFSGDDALMLDYLPGHVMDPAGDQTFQVEGGEYSFPLAVEITANARTMVMFEQLSVTAGSIGGFSHTVFDVPNGVDGTTFNVKWTAPAGDWTEEKVTFYNYSHCLDKDPCPENLAQDITWTFVNAGGDTPSSDDNSTDDGKDSPALPVVAALGAFAVVAALRRRR